ncbi:MAG: hypothetical protein ACK2T7_01170 [Anaerolineales bacterium]
MPARKRSGVLHFLVTGFMILFLLGGCGSPETPVGPQLEETAPSELPSETPVVPPTPTATPLPAKVVFIPSDAAGIDLAAFSQRVSELTAQSGWVFEERPSLQVNEISGDWRIVVMAGYDPLISEALTAHPDVQFIVMSDQDLGLAPNLSVIRLRWDYQAFIAGYLSILITPDWRTAGLFTPDNLGQVQSQAFVNGAQYFCGICASKLSPIVRFPVTAMVSGKADPGTWQTEAESLLSNIVYVMYAGPGSSSPDQLADLGQRGLVLVGGETPPDGMQTRWAATIRIDVLTALETIWSGAAVGEGGMAIDSSVVIQDINEDFYSTGRQRLVEETLQELEAGLIYPLDVPLQ